MQHPNQLCHTAEHLCRDMKVASFLHVDLNNSQDMPRILFFKCFYKFYVFPLMLIILIISCVPSFVLGKTFITPEHSLLCSQPLGANRPLKKTPSD